MNEINFTTFRHHFRGRFRSGGRGWQQVYVLDAEGEIQCGETQREMEVQGVCVWGVGGGNPRLSDDLRAQSMDMRR